MATFTPMLAFVRKDDALGQHQVQPPIEHTLLHLELRDAVPEKTADAVVTLEYRHRVTGAIELGGSRQASRGLSRRRRRCARYGSRAAPARPTLLERAVDDRHFDRLDGDRIVVDPEHARSLARGGAQAAVNSGKLFVACSRSIADCQRSR
jgi:hypothetical protein